MPTASGSSVKSGSTLCRKGSCTSSECSSACACALTVTCGRWAMLRAAAASSVTRPSGVSNASTLGQRQAAHRDAMGGAEQHHAADARGNWLERGIGGCRDGAGIDITGMRDDQGFGGQGVRLRLPPGVAARHAQAAGSRRGRTCQRRLGCERKTLQPPFVRRSVYEGRAGRIKPYDFGTESARSIERRAGVAACY